MTNKDQNISSVTQKNTFKRGLRRTLLTWFLVFSIIPLIVVSVVSYKQAHDNLQDAAFRSLSSIAKLKTVFINKWYSYRLKDLEFQITNSTNVRFLQALKEAFGAGGKDVAEFVRSDEWTSIVKNVGGDLKKFKQTYGYYNLFLIDDDGNILFSVAEEDDLGTNLKTGLYKETRFARKCMEAFETGRPVFSDLEFYSPSNDTLAGFLIQAMVDEDGNRIGLMAFQIKLDKINLIMQERTGLGATGETYLVGKDFLMRSAPDPDKKSLILDEKAKVETDIIKAWHRTHFSREYKGKIEKGEKASEKVHNVTEVNKYIGRNGVPVLGFINHLEIAGVPMAVVAEIEQKEAFASTRWLRAIVFSLLSATVVLVVYIAFVISRDIVRPIKKLSVGAKRVAMGQLDHEIEVKSKNEIGELADSFNDMLHNLRQTTEKNEAHNWLRTGQTELNVKMQGEQDIGTLGGNIISYLAEYLNVQIGALYMAVEDGRLKLIGSYAYTRREDLSSEFLAGEGLVGQAAIEKKHILVTNCPANYISIYSGLGEAIPKNILVFPLILNNTVKGIVELGAFDEFTDSHMTFLEEVAEGIAITLNSFMSRNRTNSLLEQTRRQAEELQTREEELRQTNEELEEHTKALKESESRLQTQQEELRQTNEELEEQSQRLEEQKKDTEKKNRELKIAQRLIEEKAREVELSSKYKSEFLANMSHELRTPLNSILLLSKLLADNNDGNLTEDDVESANAIHSSGTDLLELISDVLDLSKVEAGKIELHIEDMVLRDLCDTMKRSFQPLATEKGLGLNMDITDGLPAHVRTDRQRIEQIVKNFISNAFKFTKEGSVTLRISRPDGRQSNDEANLPESGFDPAKTISFSVIDTGVGIPEEKQKLIFEEFQQADGTTSRKYGGTGLGLSISKGLANLLGGEIRVESVQGKGSTFTLYLPETLKSEVETKETSLEPLPVNQPACRTDRETESDISLLEKKQPEVSADRIKALEAIEDDRKTISPEDKSVLIIEDDPRFLKILRDLSHERGFKCLVAGEGETGLQFAQYYKPSAIILDIGLPGISGWAVMVRLKENPATRHIPVHFISAADKELDAMKMGAVDYLTKPVSPEALEQVYDKLNKMISKSVKDLLVVEDNADQAEAIAKIIGNGDVRITVASTVGEAYDLVLSGKFDCMVLDLGLSDMSGVELLDKIRNNEDVSRLPIIIYTGRELTEQQRKIISKYADSTIIKGAGSQQKLLDDTTLFLHRVETNLSEEQQKMIRMIHDKEAILTGKKVLVVDDDMRNVFSLKKVLEDKGVEVLVGKNGKEGLKRLNDNPEIDLVLMDIMMPEMDGYEAMEEIRKQERFKDLPIIALTAKAMKGDRAKCIEAGASDYMTKPVDTDRLFSVLRVWLYK
ncbi:MAG: response regulator [Candidatus Scalindua sediminis]|nr:response regulator [Candidatus Scalindua sediminis]